MKITLDRLNAFLQAKGISDRCPACGREDWILQAESTSDADGSVELTEVNLFGGLIGGPLLATVVFTCGNCGYVRSHQLSVLEDWLAANRPGTADSASAD